MGPWLGYDSRVSIRKPRPPETIVPARPRPMEPGRTPDRPIMPAAQRLSLSLWLLPAFALGCGDAPSSASIEGGASADDDEQSEQDLGYLEELAHLGYVDFGVPDANGEAAGVLVHDRDAAWSGINLYTSLPDSAALLMDMEGRVLHTWRDRSGIDTRWSRVELLPDGDVLCVSPKENYLLRMAWDGTVRWRVEIDAHHDVRLTPEGQILVLTRSLRRIPAVHATRYSVDNAITLLSAEGEVLTEHSLYDILSSVPELPIEAPANIDRMPSDANVDPIHSNALELMRFAHLAEENPIFAPGNLLLTLRHARPSIVIIAPEEERVVWWWGTDELEGPHDASVMPNGHILVFDNGWGRRGYSRVLELDPVTRTLVWEYTAPEPSDFFSAGRGTAQSLPNGNVLIGNSNSGEAFEVTRAGRVVWRFLNPSVDEHGGRAALRIRRFEHGWIEAIQDRVAKGQ